MKKQDICDQIFEESNQTISVFDIRKIVDAFMEKIKQANMSGEDVFLRGFGTFRVVKRKAKVCQNIKKHTSIILPERFAPSFKPCKEFKNNVGELEVK